MAKKRGAGPIKGENEASPAGVTATPASEASKRQRRGAGSEAAPAGASPPVQASPGDGLVDYERRRNERVKRNLEVLAALSIPAIPQAAEKSKPKKGASQRGLPAALAAQSNAERPPLRASARLRGAAAPDALAAGIADERRDGSVVLAGGDAALEAAGPAGKSQHVFIDGAALASTLPGPEGSDAAFLAMLRGAPAPSPKAKAAAASPPPCTALRQLAIADGVAKVVPKGAVMLEFMPRSDALLLAVGDKEGNVALWDVATAGARGGGPYPTDGLLLTRPHGQYCSGMRWAAGGRLVTSSYEGNLRALDCGAGQWLQLWAGGKEERNTLSAFECDPAGATAYVGTNHGSLRVVDLRAAGGAAGPTMAAAQNKINVLHLSPCGAKLLASSTDAVVRVWDVRGGLGPRAKPLLVMEHAKSCQGAYFSPASSSRVLTTCYDNTLRVWATDGAAPRCVTSVVHDCHTGRWLSPLRAVWAPGGDAFVVGSMRRQTLLLDAATGTVLASYASDLQTAVASRHCCHPTLPAIAAGTASGRVYVLR